MAEKINIIVTPEALKDLEIAIKRVETLKTFINDAGTPSGNNNYTEQLKKQSKEIKTLADIITETAKNQNNLTERNKSAVIAEDNLTKAIKKRFDIFEKEANSANAKKTLQDRDAALKKLNGLTKEATELEEKRQKILNKGYGSDKELNKVAKKFEDLNLRIKEASASLLKLDQEIHKVGDSSAVPKLQIVANRQKVDEKVAQQNEKERISAEKLLASNEKLSRAYVQLTANREKAKNKLQDYIAEENRSTKEIKEAQKQFDVLNKKVAAADKAVGRFSDANRKINGLASSVGNLMAAFGVVTGVNLFADVVKNIYETTKALQSMDLALKMVSETDVEFAQNKQFVTEVANKWGLEIKSLQQTYTQFYTASKGLLSDNAIKTTFEGIAKAGSVMGLSLEQQQSAFYAIDQMMSKGTVTAEELKKQLGNAMPGAIKAAAMAYMELHPAIKTIQEAEKGLYADMKKGAIDSATYVPLIAKNFQILYGIESLNSVQTMQSAQNRLQNSWTEWIRGVSSGGAGLKMIVSVIDSLAKNLDNIATVLGFSITGWIAYKGVIMLAALEQKRLLLVQSLTSTVTAAQTTATGSLTVAQTANVVVTNAVTGAWARLRLAMMSTGIGGIIVLLGAVVSAVMYFHKSLEETTAAVKEETDAFITNREIVAEAVIENEKLIKRYEELSKKTKLTKEEQSEYNDILAKLSKQVPDAVTSVNNYGVALKLNTDLLKKYNKELLIQSNNKRIIALAENKDLLPRQQKEARWYERELKRLQALKKRGTGRYEGEDIDVAIARAENESSVKANIVTMTEARIKSMESETEAKKTKVAESKKINEEEIKNIQWYDTKISELEKTKEVFTKRGEGLEYQKKLKQLQKERAYILGEEEKKTGGSGTGTKRERKQIDFTEYTSAIELRKAELEREKAILEDRMNNEETSLDQRLKLRAEFSTKSIQILDEEMQREQAISAKKMKEDLAEVARALKNGDIKTEAEAEKQRVAIRNRTANELGKIDIDYSTKWNDLMDADNDYYKKIQREKRELADETASILISIEKDKFDRIVKDEELGINYSLKARQKAFDASIALSRKELDLEHIKALARATSAEEIAKIQAAYEKANIAIDNIISPMKEAHEETIKFIESFSDGALEKSLESLGFSSAKLFLDFDVNGQSTFMKLWEGAETTKEKFAVAFQAIGDVVQDALSKIGEASDKRYEAEFANLDKQKEIALKNAGDSTAAKEKIEADYEKKKKEVEKRQFKSRQRLALANIAIDTAQAIVGLWVKPGFPAAIPMAITMGALGLLQAGKVASEKPPEYWIGTDNAKEGLALTQERGAEIITDRKGKIKTFGSHKGAVLTRMQSGDKVFNAEESKRMMFENEYRLKATTTNTNNGMTADEMRLIMVDTLGGRPTLNMNFDKGGFGSYISKNGNITRQSESRGSGRGIEV